MTVPPVVVTAETDSKIASDRLISSDDAMKGTAPAMAIVTQPAMPRAGPSPQRTMFSNGQTIVLDSAQAAKAAEILGARQVVPVHYDSWSHFTEGQDALVAAFTAAGLRDRLDLGDRG